MQCVALLALLIPANALLRGAGQNAELSLVNMHPEQVFKLLHTVELRWEESKSHVLENKTTESDAVQEMMKSCKKVARAIIDGSEGDKDKVTDYMQDVCAVNSGGVDEDQKKCMTFASTMEKAMGDDPRFNREELDLSKLCQSYWAGPVTDAAQILAQKVTEDEAKEAKEEEERAKEEAQKAAEKAAADAKEQMANQLHDALNKSAAAGEHIAQVEQEVSQLESSMAADDANATKFLDQARQEEQVAEEKEVKAAEAEAQKSAVLEAANSRTAADEKVEATASLNTTAADEENAIKEGDAQAEAIAEKAVKKAEVAQAANTTVVAKEENTTAAQDDSKAIQAGDALAKKIADKALKKAALVTKKH